LHALRRVYIWFDGIRCMRAVFGPYTVAIGNSLAPSRALIADRYWRKGYTPNHILTSHGAVIDVLLDGNVVGTVLVTLDSLPGLSADEAYAPELNSIRGDGRRLAELSRFAILPGQTTRSVMAAMFHFVYYYTYLLNGVTDLVCEVIPRHAAAQKRILGFRQIAGPRRCNRVGAGAAVLLHRTLEWL
jgi:hypothetical protein